MDLAHWKASPLYLAVRDITAGPDTQFKYAMTAVLHTAGQDYKIFQIVSEDIVRDYSEAMMDEIVLVAKVPMGDYIYLVYPNKNNLEITVTKRPLAAVGDSDNRDLQIEEVRYKCIFDPTKNPSFAGSDIANFKQAELNNGQMATFTLRLQDRNAEPMRVKMMQGGVYRGVKNSDFIKAILLGESQNILVDGQPAVTGIDMVDPDNDEVIPQVVISSGTHVCEVPTMLQTDEQGVYKYGIGTYLQRFGDDNIPHWFVYPLYDFDRFDNGKEKNVAIFYAAPPKFHTSIEKTWRVNSGVLEVITGTGKYQHNSADVNQLNGGVGFRFADPGAFMKKPVIIDKKTGSAIAARGNLNQETSYMQRDDGLQYAPVVKNMGSNMYNELSKIAQRQATILTFGWQHADESKIYPGMPMKYCYLENDEMRELKGTILGVQANRTRQGTAADPDLYATQCLIICAAELNQQLPQYDGAQSFDPTA